jgi:hypothetical protein
MAAGVYRPGDPVAVAEVLWTAAHGVVSLEVAGILPPSAERFAAATDAAARWFVPPVGSGGTG